MAKANESEKERRGIRRRIRDRLEAGVREVTALFDVLVNEPRKFPAALVRSIRSALHRLWQSRGGGLYGLGVVGAFVYLEIRTVVVEFAESEGVAEFLVSEIFEFILRFSFMSFVNGALAAIWPLLLVGWIGVWPVLALVCGGYWISKRWDRRRQGDQAGE